MTIRHPRPAPPPDARLRVMRRSRRPHIAIAALAAAVILTGHSSPAASETGSSREPTQRETLAAGLHDALAALDGFENPWRSAHAWLVEAGSLVDRMAAWQLRRNTVVPWVRSFGNGVDAVLGLFDPSELLPRFNLQIYRVLAAWPIHSKRTSEYGYREDPLHGHLRYHKGIDFRAARGTPIRAAAAGVVRIARRWDAYGRAIVIDHGQGVETRYGHLSRFRVSEGDFVAANALIGFSGATGRATGPHLHFEVRHEGRAVDPDRAFAEQSVPAPEPANLRELLQFWIRNAEFADSLKLRS